MNGLWLVVPLAAASVAGFVVMGLGSRSRWPAAVIAVAGSAVGLVVALVAALRGPWAQPVLWGGPVVQTGGPTVQLATILDGLGVVVAVMVTAIALGVQVYSVEYLRTDRRYASYAAFVSLFTVAMLVVVVGGDLVILLIGWEVMGLCSYVLIGHDRELPIARAAALKAFLVTRLGDAAFMVGILVLGFSANSFRIADVIAHVPAMAPGTRTVAALLLIGGVVGKSAQFPLHVWLPDAMAGPTPVSALIHAATMVAAGVFVVARLFPVFESSSVALSVLGVVAAVSMLGAALAATAQADIKRVLAYSTVSQLAYMVGALACGSVSAAMFHLLVHAAFKALGFLAAGAIIHAVGSNLMSQMGGLGRRMRVTAVTMTIAMASGAGVIPLAGFFSKESVVSAAEAAASGHVGNTPTWVGWLVLVSALATVAVTAAYSARLLLLTFAGAYRGAGEPHDPPPLMRVPLIVLAVPAAALGVLGLSREWLPRWLASPFVASGSQALTPGLALAAFSLALVAVAGVGVWVVWRRDPAGDPATALGRLRGPFESGFGLDQWYERAFIGPLRRASRGVVGFDDRAIGSAVQGIGVRTGRASHWLRGWQTGNPQLYLTGSLAGVAVLLIAALVSVVVLA
jgi:NADH-quinone oxidoreductase subunit L